MTVKEKTSLLLNGVKWAQIQELEEQEKLEIEAEAAKGKEEESKEQPETPTLDDALKLIKELQEKLSEKDDEVSKLNNDLASVNNHQTIAEQPVKETSVDVFKELFHPEKKEV